MRTKLIKPSSPTEEGSLPVFHSFRSNCSQCQTRRCPRTTALAGQQSPPASSPRRSKAASLVRTHQGQLYQLLGGKLLKTAGGQYPSSALGWRHSGSYSTRVSSWASKETKITLMYRLSIVPRASLFPISHSLVAPISCFNYNYLCCTSAMEVAMWFLSPA